MKKNDSTPSAPENLSLDYKKCYEELLQKHQMMLSKISHEIRNPVTLINGFLQLLENHHPELSQDYYMQKVMENMEFLKALLEDFSTFNNSETLHVKPIDLAQLFCETIESVIPALKHQQIQIQLNVSPYIPSYTGDPVKLRQLLLNLLRNAQEAISSQGIIRCSLSCKNNQILITVKDNGNGIPEDYKKDLFHPFVTHKQEGTGLGLPICQKIVAAHHGTISYSSTPETGTEFTILLPVS